MRFSCVSARFISSCTPLFSKVREVVSVSPTERPVPLLADSVSVDPVLLEMAVLKDVPEVKDVELP